MSLVIRWVVQGVLAVLVVLTGAWALPAEAAFEVYVSATGTNPGVPAEIPIETGGGEPAISLDVYVHNGGGAASAEPCAGTLAGPEVCMWDLNITADPNIQIVSFTAADPGTVANPQPSFVRLNGGDPINGKTVPEFVGTLEVRATGPGNLNVPGEQFVDNLLNASTAAQGTPIATACTESEPAGQGDDLCDASDPCDTFQNTIPLVDQNGDGIPDECQCGDANQDGFILFADAQILANCVLVPANCTVDITIGDTNDDGFLLFADAQRAAAVVLQNLQSSDLTCARRPLQPAP